MAIIDQFIDEDIAELARLFDVLEMSGIPLSEILTERQCHLIREIELATGKE